MKCPPRPLPRQPAWAVPVAVPVAASHTLDLRMMTAGRILDNRFSDEAESLRHVQIGSGAVEPGSFVRTAGCRGPGCRFPGPLPCQPRGPAASEACTEPARSSSARLRFAPPGRSIQAPHLVQHQTAFALTQVLLQRSDVEIFIISSLKVR